RSPSTIFSSNDPSTPATYTLSLHDALPIYFAGPHDRKPIFHFDTRDVQSAHAQLEQLGADALGPITDGVFFTFKDPDGNLLMVRSEEHTSELQSRENLVCRLLLEKKKQTMY